MKINSKDRNIKKKNISSPQIIPESEKWLYENPEALASLEQGLKEAKEGKLTKINLEEL